MRPKLMFLSQRSDRAPAAKPAFCELAVRGWASLVMAGLAACGSLLLASSDVSAQSTRGSAGSAGTLPPAQLIAPGQTFGAAGGTRGSAAGLQPGQPVNYAQPVQGLQPTPDQITSTPQFGVAANGSTPYLAGQASNTGLPLVSEDYEQLGGIDVAPLASVTGPSAAPSGPPQSFLAVPGSPYSLQSSNAAAAPVSTGPSGARPSGPPKSTLLVASPSGIDYSKLPSSLDSSPTQRSASDGERKVSSAKSGSGSLPSLTPLKLPTASSEGGSDQSASSGDSSTTRTTPSLSLTPPSSTGSTGTARPSLSLNGTSGAAGSSNSSAAGSNASGNSGGALTIPQLPSLSLNGTGGSTGGSTGLSTGTGAASSGLSLTAPSKPTNFQITGYRSGGTGVPATSLSQLNALARAMASDPKIKVRLVSYAKPSGQISARTLSATRAVLVRKHLIQSGIDESRISIRARGDNNGAVASDRIDVEVQG